MVSVVNEPVIERAEVVALLFDVSDIASRGSNDCWTQRAQMLANAQRTRELAELTQAKLDADAPRR
jgi:hypothetical protein